MAEHNELGLRGEQLAANYLIDNGYEILEQNWRFKRYEIDLIAKQKDILIFFEIKTRSREYFGEPAAQVDDQQMKRIAQIASVYMHQIGHDWEVRFDIIGILCKSPQSVEIKHYKDVWFDGW